MECAWYWYDLTTGETHLYEDYDLEPAVFSIYKETADYFIGWRPDGRKYISKQDYYNENYNAAF